MIPTNCIGPTGSARDVLDWISYMQLVDYVHSKCDNTETALTVMSSFLRGNASARRGRTLT